MKRTLPSSQQHRQMDDRQLVMNGGSMGVELSTLLNQKQHGLLHAMKLEGCLRRVLRVENGSVRLLFAVTSRA